MASLEKRTGTGGRPALRVVWRENGQKQSETFGPGRELQAKAFLRDVEASGDRWPQGWVKGVGYPRPGELLSGYTVRSACIRAIDVNQRADRGTLAGYRREVDRYLPEGDPLADLPVEKVTVEDILDWHIRLRQRHTSTGGPIKSQRITDSTLSSKTRRGAHSRLSSGLSLMVKMDHIPRNLATGLGPGKSKRKKVQALSVEEYRTLLAYIPDHYKPLIETLARTGMRFSEATALLARRVELNRDVPLIHVEEAWKRTERYGVYVRGGPKSMDGHRVVPIDPQLTEMLSVLLDQRRGNEEVFQTVYGTVISYNNFHQRVWRPAVFAALEDDVLSFEPTLHDLRHAHASWLLDEGIPVMTVADRLGHDPAVLLRIYAHLMDKARHAPAEAIARLFAA